MPQSNDNDNMNAIRRELQALAEKQATAETEERKEVMISIASVQYDKAAIYTNIVLGIGYVAFFTVWSGMRDALGPTQRLWSALLMLISVTVFVLWETAKMIYASRDTKEFANALELQGNAFEDALARATRSQKKRSLRLGRLWHGVLGVTILTGLPAMVILIVEFVFQLFD
jgi:hypothetical protein